MTPRRPAQHRRPSDQPQAARLSPWHLLGLGLVALIGTGILAAVDRSRERAASSQHEVGPPLARGDAQIGRAAETSPTPLPHLDVSRTSTLSYVPAHSEAAPAPPSDTGRENRSLFVSPARAAGAEAPVSQPATPSVAPALVEASAERTPQRAESPTVTASLGSAASPARPPDTAAAQSAVTRGALKTSGAAATECLPGELRAVLADVAARFGAVTVVSTHQLNTSNHSSGSIREKLHHDCKAADIRVDRGRVDEIKAYLRGRREIVGLESYRNGIIHLDVSGGAGASTRSQARAGRRSSSEAPQPPAAAPQEPPAPAQSLFLSR